MNNKHKEWCKASSYKIAKFDLKTGQKLDEFESIYQAAKELGDASKSSNISKAVNGKLKSCYGYKWVKLYDSKFIPIEYFKNNFTIKEISPGEFVCVSNKQLLYKLIAEHNKLNK